MRIDSEIKEDVLDELMWQPNIDETQIGVIVEKGIVTLTGFVDAYAKKTAALNAVKNVKGVKAIANDIEVKYGTDYKKTDKEIAKAVVNALTWNASVPDEKLTIEVRDGWVHLSGELEWHYQKDAARKTVENLLGVKGVINNITLKQKVVPSKILQKITNAFERLAHLEAKNIKVEVDGNKVKLKGKVNSYAEKEAAKRTAFFAPGVSEVEDEIVVN